MIQIEISGGVGGLFLFVCVQALATFSLVVISINIAKRWREKVLGWSRRFDRSHVQAVLNRVLVSEFLVVVVVVFVVGVVLIALRAALIENNKNQKRETKYAKIKLLTSWRWMQCLESLGF